MAFPVVDARNTSNRPQNGTDHTVNLPASIQADDLLIVVFITDGNPTITWPGSWAVIAHINNSVTVEVGWLKASGGETSIEITTSNNQISAHSSLRISGGADPASSPPTASTGATGTDTSPDPDTHTPGGGSQDFLWIAAAGHDDGSDDITTAPSGYSNLNQLSSDASQGCGVATAELSSAGATEDPGAFVLDSSEQWVACTISVFPTAVIPPSGRRIFNIS